MSRIQQLNQQIQNERLGGNESEANYWKGRLDELKLHEAISQSKHKRKVLKSILEELVEDSVRNAYVRGTEADVEIDIRYKDVQSIVRMTMKDLEEVIKL